ncbi:DUF4265 domain-containing protein [Corynebacterium rouxii]|uniref:DUF4265 domain-containing protein n=2 Tax=Corynebacterium rouxii TaxID=2719119 RepID=A0A6I8M820_9CORY|nr:DUF4265 domain-containing protein [Corynebacterium rouxii]VZH84001.1 hypothetical protein FRC0190_00049 [Corynebacterium rouxii]
MNSIISTIPSLPGVDSEQLHARDLGDGYYVITSVPFTDPSLALGDIVEVAGGLIIAVVTRGGGRTLRILTSDQCPNVVDPLLELGCHVESGPAGILGVCVPADAPYDSIVLWLEDLHDQQLLQLAEYSPSR